MGYGGSVVQRRNLVDNSPVTDRFLDAVAALPNGAEAVVFDVGANNGA
jgi:hypothetical protein